LKINDNKYNVNQLKKLAIIKYVEGQEDYYKKSLFQLDVEVY